jgi:hypothetical protein
LVRDTLHACLDANGTTTLSIDNYMNQTIIWDDPNYNSYARIVNAPGEYWAIVKNNDSCTVKRHLFIVTNFTQISGNHNTCDSITNYTVSNPEQWQTYQWSIHPSNAGTIIQNNNSSITVNWHDGNISPLDSVFIKVANLCNDTTSFKIWRCCSSSRGVLYHDTLITSNFPSGVVYINGTVTINNSITQSATTFLMGSDAKIIVNTPYTFTINGSTTIGSGCRNMWDGIYLTTPQSSIIAQNITYIRDAFNAIVSENGANVNVSNTIFNKNLKAIVVKNATGANPLTVTNCMFFSTTDATGQIPCNLIPPYNFRRGMTGIEISNMNSVTVGNTNKATKNKFSYLDFGIDISNSNVNVYNNNFINMPTTNANNGAGVKVAGNATDQYTVNIGGYNSGSTIYTNLFNNCFAGIVSINPVNIKVLCDTFVSNAFASALIGSNSLRNIDFTKNRLESSPMGLYVYDFVNSRLVVDSNSLYNTTTGLYAANATAQECHGATFRKNTITGTFTNGILLSNVRNCTSIMVGYPGHERQIPYIYANTITFGSCDLSGSTVYSGIRIENGNNTYIEENNVSTPSMTVTTSTQAQYLNGIYAIASPKTTLCSNTLTRLGMGIRFSGLCTASPIKSNSMNNNYYGVRLENATIGNQGNPSASIRWVNRNWWHTPFVTGRYRVQGSVAAATTWTYDASIPSTNYTLLSSTSEYSVTGGFTSTAITNPVPQGCGYDGIIWIPYTGGVGGDAMINEAQSDELATMPLFTADIEENQYYQASAFYANAQTENPNMSVSENEELTDNPIQTTSIPQFDQVNKLISTNRIDDAIAVNDAIVPKNLIEKNHKITNGIYLNSWAKGRFELTDDEHATLLQIATQPHIQSGYGVITAWVMLNRVYHTESVKPKNIVKPFRIANNEITIYPNPAREQVTVSGASEIAFATVYDMQGRELIKTGNASGTSAFTMDTAKLSKGIYFITLVNKDLSVIKTEKLVIE